MGCCCRAWCGACLPLPKPRQRLSPEKAAAAADLAQHALPLPRWHLTQPVALAGLRHSRRRAWSGRERRFGGGCAADRHRAGKRVVSEQASPPCSCPALPGPQPAPLPAPRSLMTAGASHRRGGGDLSVCRGLPPFCGVRAAVVTHEGAAVWCCHRPGMTRPPWARRTRPVTWSEARCSATPPAIGFSAACFFLSEKGPRRSSVE